MIYDDQSNPATAVRLYEKLITEDKVDAVMGPYSSAVSEAAVRATAPASARTRPSNATTPRAPSSALGRSRISR